MYLETIKSRNKNQRAYYHYLVTGGKYGRRKYVNLAELPAIKAEITAERSRKKFLAGLRSAVRHAKPGPVPAINEVQRIMLDHSGYRLHGGLRLTKDRKKFLARKEVAFRHSMLSAAAREIARTPDDLLRLEKKALSLQAALSASKVRGTTFEMCLSVVFAISAAAMAGSAGTGASSPTSVRHSADSPC